MKTLIRLREFAQSDQNLRWVHMFDGTVSDIADNIMVN